MAEGAPAVTPPHAPPTPAQLRGEVGLIRRRITIQVNGIEDDVTGRVQAVKDALSYAALTSVVSGSLRLALRRIVARVRRG